MTSHSEVLVEPTERRVRWRIMSAWFLMGFGGLMLAVSLPPLLYFLFLLFRHGAAAFEVLYLALPGVGLNIACALLLITAGWLLMNKRWGWMTLALVIAYAAGVSGAMLSQADAARQRASSIAPIVPDRSPANRSAAPH